MRVQCLCIDENPSFCIFGMLFVFSVKEMRLEISLTNLRNFLSVHTVNVHLDLI